MYLYYKHKGKKYDFAKYTSSDAISDSDDTSSTTKKFNPRKVSFKDKSTDEVDPIQSNSNMFLDNDDAIQEQRRVLSFATPAKAPTMSVCIFFSIVIKTLLSFMK